MHNNLLLSLLGTILLLALYTGACAPAPRPSPARTRIMTNGPTPAYIAVPPPPHASR